MAAAIVLANLCVAYIMTNANEEAEEIMRRIEEEEARCVVAVVACVAVSAGPGINTHARSHTCASLSTPSASSAARRRQAAEAPSRPAFHLCIVNLVVGTLYCSRGNYEFGVGRVLQAMHPLQAKLGTDTWYYAKRCLLSLAEGVAKHMVTLTDDMLGSVYRFLDAADAHGKGVPAVMARGALSECASRARALACVSLLAPSNPPRACMRT